MWNQTKITALLGIQYPILQGPMGGSFSTADLLASVSNAGGLGSYGAYTLSPEEILAIHPEIKAKTNKPFNINLWVNDVDDSLKDLTPEKIEQIKGVFKPYYDALNIELPELSANIPSKFEKQVESVFQIRPAVFSFIFGVPSKEILAEARKLGIKTVGSATTVEEGLALEAAGVDAIVAAGFEGGGHRPSFLKPAQDSLTGTFTLIQQLKAVLRTPVIAAGGIIDGKGIAAALTLGADAVQIGTAFLACEESNATPLHRELLFSKENTVLSKSLTGRMGRLIRNRIAEEVKFETEVLPFPLQTKLVAPLRVAALKAGRSELVSFWSGQNTSTLQYHKAAELMAALVKETGEILK